MVNSDEFFKKYKVTKEFTPQGEEAKPGKPFYTTFCESYVGTYRYAYEKDAVADAKLLAKRYQEEVMVLKPITVVSPKIEVEVKRVQGF